MGAHLDKVGALERGSLSPGENRRPHRPAMVAARTAAHGTGQTTAKRQWPPFEHRAVPDADFLKV